MCFQACASGALSPFFSMLKRLPRAWMCLNGSTAHVYCGQGFLFLNAVVLKFQ